MKEFWKILKTMLAINLLILVLTLIGVSLCSFIIWDLKPFEVLWWLITEPTTPQYVRGWEIFVTIVVSFGIIYPMPDTESRK